MAISNRRILRALGMGALAVYSFASGVPASTPNQAAAENGKASAPAANPVVGLSASLFSTARTGQVNNVALLWASSLPCDSFELFRAQPKDEKPGDFTSIYRGTGASFNDYGLKAGGYFYKLVARRGTETVISNFVSVNPVRMPAGVKEYSNQTGTGAEAFHKPLKIGNTYYRFDSEKDGEKSRRYIVKTSVDGKEWKTGPVVLDHNSHPDLADFKFESGTIFYDKVRDRIVWWCHWERSGPRYGDGRAFVATAKPGEPFVVHRIYNPLGVQVRDMSIFVDDDKQGYLVAASNVAGQGANATLTLFKLNADYTDVTGIVGRVMENQYREAPHILHRSGFYYLFFSQAAGWYPSRAGYISAPTLAGPWSEPRTVGNTSTFSAQSGAVMEFGEGASSQPVLMANRWIRGEGTSGNAIVPLHCAMGFALGDYAPTLLVTPTGDRIIPLQMGQLLSQNQPATASIVGSKDHEVDKAFDGDYNTSFQSDDKKWPFTATTDLGAVCAIRNVQISWHLHKGSEAYYKYSIEGSPDGNTWSVLLQRTDPTDSRVSKTYGFSSDVLPDGSSARFVRINVQQAVLHNNPNNWYPPTLYEVKVYGDRPVK